MRLFLKLILFTLLFTVARVSTAADLEETSLKKADLDKIKIISKDQNRIHFFLTDSNLRKYRIGNLTQKQAESILASLKNDESLRIKSQPNQRGYRDVVEWHQSR